MSIWEVDALSLEVAKEARLYDRPRGAATAAVRYRHYLLCSLVDDKSPALLAGIKVHLGGLSWRRSIDEWSNA